MTPKPPRRSIFCPRKRVVVDSRGYGFGFKYAIPRREKHLIKKENNMPIAKTPKTISEQTKQSEKPLATFNYRQVNAALWGNKDANGKLRVSVTLSRSYKAGDSWKRSTSFGLFDLDDLENLIPKLRLGMASAIDKSALAQDPA